MKQSVLLHRIVPEHSNCPRWQQLSGLLGAGTCFQFDMGRFLTLLCTQRASL